MRTKGIAAWLAAGLLAPLAARAAEGEGEAISPFAGDFGTALWTLVIFLVVVYVLGRFAWGPVLSGLQGREDFIRRSLEEARADREAAERTLREYEAKLAAARAEATAIVDEGRRDAEVVKQRIEEGARLEAEKILQRARREIDLAKQAALKELYARVETLATAVAARILERELDPARHRDLIAASIERLEKSEPS